MSAFTLEELHSMVVVNIADYKLGQGKQKFITHDLGSCVGIAIHDPQTHVGGLLHIMLPESKSLGSLDKHPNPAKYADAGIEKMINDLTIHGANRERLVAKIAGAAHVIKLKNMSEKNDISSQNLYAVQKKLKEMEIPILASEVGANYPRTVVFELETGIMRIVTSGMKDRIL